jgi:hypothetical protein
MKKLFALCLAPFRRRAPMRRQEDESDFLKRVREAGL